MESTGKAGLEGGHCCAKPLTEMGLVADNFCPLA